MKTGVSLLLVALALGGAARADSVMNVSCVSMSSSQENGNGMFLIPGMSLTASPGLTSLVLLGSRPTPAIVSINPLLTLHASPSLILLPASNLTLIPGLYAPSLLTTGQHTLIPGYGGIIGTWYSHIACP